MIQTFSFVLTSFSTNKVSLIDLSAKKVLNLVDKIIKTGIVDNGKSVARVVKLMIRVKIKKKKQELALKIKQISFNISFLTISVINFYSRVLNIKESI